MGAAEAADIIGGRARIQLRNGLGRQIISEARSRYPPAPAGRVRPQLSDRQIALASSDVGDDHGVPVLERGPIPPSAATGRRRPGVRAGQNHVLRGRAAYSRADIIESNRASNRPKHRESPRRLRDYAVYLEHEPHPQMRPLPPRRSSYRAPAATDSGQSAPKTDSHGHEMRPH